MKMQGTYIAQYMHSGDEAELGTMFCGAGWYIFRQDIPDPPNDTRLCIAYVRSRNVAWRIRDALNASEGKPPTIKAIDVIVPGECVSRTNRSGMICRANYPGASACTRFKGQALCLADKKL